MLLVIDMNGYPTTEEANGHDGMPPSHVRRQVHHTVSAVSSPKKRSQKEVKNHSFITLVNFVSEAVTLVPWLPFGYVQV